MSLFNPSSRLKKKFSDLIPFSWQGYEFNHIYLTDLIVLYLVGSKLDFLTFLKSDYIL